MAQEGHVYTYVAVRYCTRYKLELEEHRNNNTLERRGRE